MNPRSPRVFLVAVAACAGLCAAGCALLSKSAPIEPRYYSPERPSDLPKAAPQPPGTPPPELRLGRVHGVSHLDELLVFRQTASELGYYRLRRWTEVPAEYLKRRLSRVLFEERGLRQTMGGGGPTLEVQLTAFEELRTPRHLARVQTIVRLHDERAVRWQETVTVDLPVVAARSGDTSDAVVEALGRAMRATVDRIADRVVRELEVAPTPASAARGDR
ncbi:MAG: membrane integrity-associated transporter subunit PqiC [Deltaproteobacteria bacterium]|nr:membrane integrity-associated transporter subunit PqiC [Deltaproteobacteria bacterium]